MSKELDNILAKWNMDNVPDFKLELEELLGHEWVGVEGIRYKVEAWGERFNDGSRHVTLVPLKHYDYCQRNQQDGDGKTCTCLDDSEKL